MKLLRTTLKLSFFIFFAFSTYSYAENTGSENLILNKEISPAKTDLLVSNYLELKNALVSDNSKKAAEAAQKMIQDFKTFKTSGFTSAQKKELAEIIENANEQVEHIAENVNNIEHQREHFEVLSNDMVDLLAITGTDKTLYQTRCPMYNKGKGGIWISETKEIKNPFYGSKMLGCGSVQKEL